MNNKKVKTFGDVKEGDFVYHVTSTNGYKTSIIKKKVTYVKSFISKKGTADYVSIICTPTSEFEWLDSYRDIPVINTSIRNRNTDPKITYLCTTLEEAKQYCNKIVEDIINKNQKEINRLNASVKQWKEHQNLLREGVYTIK